MKNIIKKYLKSFVIAAILVLICNILNVTHPYIIKQVVDIDFTQNDIINKLLTLFIAYLTVHILLAVMKNIRNIQNNKLMANILKDIREKVFCKVLSFNMKTFNKYNSSEIYTRLTADTANLFDLFFGFIQIIVNNITYIIFMVAMMFVANVNLALIGGATIILVGIVSFAFTKKLKSLDSKILDKRDLENREFSEMYNKHKLTYLFGLQKNNIDKISSMLDSELKSRKNYIFLHTISYPVMLVLEACRNICSLKLCFKYKHRYPTWRHIPNTILYKTMQESIIRNFR